MHSMYIGQSSGERISIFFFNLIYLPEVYQSKHRCVQVCIVWVLCVCVWLRFYFSIILTLIVVIFWRQSTKLRSSLPWWCCGGCWCCCVVAFVPPLRFKFVSFVLFACVPVVLCSVFTALLRLMCGSWDGSEADRRLWKSARW